MYENHSSTDTSENNPRPLKRVVIKEEIIALLGHYVQAILLEQFLYWGRRTRDFDKFIQEEARRKPDTPQTELTRGWIYKSARELKSEIMINMSTDTIERNLKKIVAKGYLQRRSNPYVKWDKTLQYRPNIKAIQKRLHELDFVLEGYSLPTANSLINKKPHIAVSKPAPAFTEIQVSKPHQPEPKPQIAESMPYHAVAIPEITTEITTKTTTETTQKNNFVKSVENPTSGFRSNSDSKSSSFGGSNGTERKIKLGFGAIPWTEQQKTEAISVLEGTEHSQGILNAINAAQVKGRIKTSPMAYLKALARRDKMGKFNCLDNNNPDNAMQPCRDTVKEQKVIEESAKDCPICDKNGTIYGSKDGKETVIGYKKSAFCPHGKEALKFADHLRKKGWLLECDKANEADEIVEIAQATEGKESMAEIMAKMKTMFNRPKNDNAAADALSEREQRVRNCEYCNEKGTVVYKDNDGQLHGKACPHNENEVKDLDEAMAEVKYWRTTR